MEAEEGRAHADFLGAQLRDMHAKLEVANSDAEVGPEPKFPNPNPRWQTAMPRGRARMLPARAVTSSRPLLLVTTHIHMYMY